MRLRSTLVLTAAFLALACNDRSDTTDSGTGPRPDGGGGPENTVAACSDGADNDGDGHVDCNDFDCCDVRTCDATTSCGRRPDGGMNGMACEGPSEPENTLEACSDGCSNDHAEDNFVDCFDFDCCDVRTDCPPTTPCGMRPRRCEGDPEPENTLAACTDGCSNDNDTFVDCEEADCCWILAEAVDRGVPGITACGSGTFCADTFTPPSGASLCDDDDLMGPPVPENSFERCSDECSNDRDRFQDCDDFDCCAIIERAVAEGVTGAVACGNGTACADMWTPRPGVELCSGDDGTGDPPAEARADLCSNECDDDRDGFEDCDDLDCCGVRSDCPATSTCGMSGS